MNRYLRAIGFSDLETKRDLETVMQDVLTNYTDKKIVSYAKDSVFVELSKEYGEDIGITVCGEYTDDNIFHYHYYYPYFLGTGLTTREEVTLERRTDREAFLGACEDIKVGVSIIFALQNMVDYFRDTDMGKIVKSGFSTTLSGLSVNGKILLPVNKDEKQIENDRKAASNRSHLLAKAKSGDEEAIENLTLEDIDMYSMISKRIRKEDVFSIVDTYFMPYGLECDQYGVLGEIEDYCLIKNTKTDEEVYELTINCNDLCFDVCINKNDLVGEPGIGRRFKGVIWMQGRLNL